MDIPIVSVVVPCFNHAKYVLECLKSIIEQDYPNIELLVIDDGSTDDSAAVIRTFETICLKRFVRYEFRSRSNLGVSATLNEGIAWCRGNYLAAIASDDLMTPNRIAKQVRYLEARSDCVGIFGGIDVIDSGGNTIRRISHKARSYTFTQILLHQHTLPAPTQMLRLSALRATSGYDPNLRIEDWYMWLLLTNSGGTLDAIPDILAKYRRHDGNFSRKFFSMHEDRLAILKTYSNNPMYDVARSHVTLQTAIDSQPFHKLESLHYLIKAVQISPRILFKKKSLKYLIKALIPKTLLIRFFEGRQRDS